MKCRRCNHDIGTALWNGWELCDHCGYRFHVDRFHVDTQQSPDDPKTIEPKES